MPPHGGPAAFLPYAPPEDAVPAPQASEVSESSGGLAVYLGFVSPHKGAKLLARYFGQRRPHGLDFEIWGHAPDWPYKDAVRPYRDWRELRSLAERYRPKLVVLPALWPETFSYTLYEALFILRVPVLVGPYGNPARVVAEHDLGVVLRGVDMTAMDAAWACCCAIISAMPGRVRDFVRERGPAFAQERYAGKLSAPGARSKGNGAGCVARRPGRGTLRAEYAHPPDPGHRTELQW